MITVKDIAQQAGVSHTTVSSALNGSGRVSPSTARQIRALAEEMKYQPRAAARLLRARRTGAVGLLLLDQTLEEISLSGWMGPLLTSFLSGCAARSTQYMVEFLTFDSTGVSGGSDAAAVGELRPRHLDERLVDGQIIAGHFGAEVAGRADSFRSWFDNQTQPVVTLDEASDHCVLSATDQGIAQAVQLLAAHGHRRIALATGSMNYPLNQLARKGFESSVERFGLSVDRDHWLVDLGALDRQQRMQRYLQWARQVLNPAEVSKEERPTAVVCTDSMIAHACIHAASQYGLQVPRDLSVIGCGPLLDAEKCYPRITSLHPDYAGLVREALDMIESRVQWNNNHSTRKDDASYAPETRVVVPQLIERETVGRAPE